MQPPTTVRSSSRPLTLGTTINFGSGAFNTNNSVSTINVNFSTAGTINNLDKIVVTGPGVGPGNGTSVSSFTITEGAKSLGLAVANVQNPGTFTVTTNGNLEGPGLTAAQQMLPTTISTFATVDNSQFSMVTIRQINPAMTTCQAAVELGGDTVNGPVLVSLASAPGDQIIAGQIPTSPGPNTFGVTTLTEGGGANDVINVGTLNATSAQVSHIQRLTIIQGVGTTTGNGDSVNVQSVQLTSPLGSGLTVTQGNGATNSATVNNVSVQGVSPACRSTDSSVNRPRPASPSLRATATPIRPP